MGYEPFEVLEMDLKYVWGSTSNGFDCFLTNHWLCRLALSVLSLTCSSWNFFLSSAIRFGGLKKNTNGRCLNPHSIEPWLNLTRRNLQLYTHICRSSLTAGISLYRFAQPLSKLATMHVYDCFPNRSWQGCLQSWEHIARKKLRQNQIIYFYWRPSCAW